MGLRRIGGLDRGPANAVRLADEEYDALIGEEYPGAVGEYPGAVGEYFGAVGEYPGDPGL